ncbi:MAG: helix-turn-helix domain-containing protein, partial [Clostridia bacterium]|nr:helix-turn-helix domain-containing protein [Clostridia bacterium]
DTFYREFGRGLKDILDNELLRTAECFVAHDLSVPKTAAALFCHRNTLLYRLERITALTGLDLRRQKDAAEFTVWLAVRRRLSLGQA